MNNAKRRKVKCSIIKVAEKFSFPILNIANTRSRRDYNQYKIAYESLFNNNINLKHFILIETFYSIKSFPIVKKSVSSIIYDYIKNNEEFKFLLNRYDLNEFIMYVQTIERTFIDKVFAICEYYLKNKVDRYSRHLYDVHKLFPLINFNNNFKKLVDETRNARFSNQNNLTVLDEYNVNELLKEIIRVDCYKSDFIRLTKNLLYENISYEDVINTLNKIIELNIF